MLSKTKMVKARKAIETLYVGKCTITEYQKVKNENKTTSLKEVVVLKDEPCRLSFGSTASASPTSNGASSISQTVKVFIAPEITVKPGSKLTITQNGITAIYKNSGEPSFYSTHQEINLELFKGWA